MLQADPLSDPGNQGLNKYTYALNNPLTLTDPTGYFSWNSFLRTAVAIGITIYTGGAAAGTWGFLGAGAGALTAGEALAVVVGGGFAAGAVQTGNLKGAVAGAFSAALFYGVGSYFQGASWAHDTGLACTANLTTAGTTAKVLAHGIAGGVMTSLQGGKFGHGFVSAGITEAFSGKINNTPTVSGKIIAAAIVGGTASVASGGRFSNGALTSAFAQAFNAGLHEGLMRSSLALKSGAISKELYQQSVAPCTGQGGECVATGVGIALGLTGLGAIGLDVAALLSPELPLALPAATSQASWAGVIVAGETTESMMMYRIWGGTSESAGQWLTPMEFTSSQVARQSLALPMENTAAYISPVMVPAGTQIQVGVAAPLFGQPGGALQVLLHNRIPASAFGPGVPLLP